MNDPSRQFDQYTPPKKPSWPTRLKRFLGQGAVAEPVELPQESSELSPEQQIQELIANGFAPIAEGVSGPWVITSDGLLQARVLEATVFRGPASDSDGDVLIVAERRKAYVGDGTSTNSALVISNPMTYGEFARYTGEYQLVDAEGKPLALDEYAEQ